MNNANNIQDLMGQMGIQDPKMQLIANFLAKNQSQAGQDTEDIDNKYSEEMEKLIQQNEILKTENEELYLRNDQLAAALGACPDCWGEDRKCENCQGNGFPGSCLPDKNLFKRIVKPVIDFLKQNNNETQKPK